MTCGIYQIINLNNNKIYVGSSVNIEKRWIRHKSLLRANNHSNKYLQNSWNKHGGEKFLIEVLCECDKKNLTREEQKFLDKLLPDYNIRTIAENNLGIKHTKETIKKMSESLRGMFTGEKSSSAILTWEQVEEIRKKYKTNLYSQENLAIEYGVKRTTIQTIINNRTWKNKRAQPIRRDMSNVNTGENSSSAKLTWKKVREIRKKYATGEHSFRKLAREYGVGKNCIANIINHVTWRE